MCGMPGGHGCVVVLLLGKKRRDEQSGEDGNNLNVFCMNLGGSSFRGLICVDCSLAQTRGRAKKESKGLGFHSSIQARLWFMVKGLRVVGELMNEATIPFRKQTMTKAIGRR
jgi:hypothetical protein